MMERVDLELGTLANQEELKFQAREVLRDGRPVLLPILVCLLVGVAMLMVDHGELPRAYRICLGFLASAVPLLIIEVWYLNRRLNALLVLQGLTRTPL